MTKPSPFNHQPDPELGQVLREALAPTDPVAFTNRVLAGFDEAQRRGLPFFDILAGWARIGVVAAVAVAIASMWLHRPAHLMESRATIDDVLAEEPVPAALAASPVPDPNTVLVIAIDR